MPRRSSAERRAPSVKSHSSSVAELVLGSRRELEARFHLEEAVEMRGEVERAEDLVLDLLGRHEDMGVVLRHLLHAKEAVERSGPLVAVERRRLGIAQRELAVAAQGIAEEEHVAGAVHRLHPERPLVAVRDEEHVVLELLPVARGDPRVDVVEQRRLHLDIAALRVLPSPQRFQDVPDDRPLRVPERHPGRVVGEMEEIEVDSRGGGGRGASPPRAARGTRRGRPARRTPCRRSASAACCARRRASTRPRGP